QLAYVTKREEEGAILAIYPDEPLDIGFFVHDPADMQRVYEMGRSTGEKYLSQVQEYLAG
ncbi:MAG: patatin family protein, partial [Clostridia bacterium]|nr:patatin family protein [Clostridia bacterium]